ncbi:MAG: cytidine deaminase [Planctomycetota bacterium]
MPTDAELLAAARQVASAAHSPYSKVRVGAALLAKDGRVFPGCNVENASYGVTICAERGACMRAVADGATEFTAIAIWSNMAHALPPCGACRQFLSEFGLDLRVVVEGSGGGRLETTLRELLPSAMGPEDLR